MAGHGRPCRTTPDNLLAPIFTYTRPLVPEMTDAERLTAIEALLARAKTRREMEVSAVLR
jgi:hypothetical protein